MVVSCINQPKSQYHSNSEKEGESNIDDHFQRVDTILAIESSLNPTFQLMLLLIGP